MNATGRAYRNIEILLARASGATGPELSQRFGLTERQARRVLAEMRATRRGQDIDAAYQLAESRLAELYVTVDLLKVKLRELSDVQGLAGLGGLILEYFYEIRDVEELMGRFPKEIDWKFKGSDAGWLWMRFKSVIKRHPGAWDEFYDELFAEFDDWVEGQLQRQGNRGHKSLGKMSAFHAKNASGAWAAPPRLHEALAEELARSIGNEPAKSATPSPKSERSSSSSHPPDKEPT